MKTCGVYLITTVDGKKYVGASVWTEKRFKVHSKRWRISKFEILEECSREFLPEREKYWIKEIHPELNQRPNQTGGAGRKAKDTSKMSAWQKGKKKPHNNGEAISNALKGKEKSEEHKAKSKEGKNSLESKEKASESSKKRWENPEFKASVSKKIKSFYNTEEGRKIAQKRAIKFWKERKNDVTH